MGVSSCISRKHKDWDSALCIIVSYSNIFIIVEFKQDGL